MSEGDKSITPSKVKHLLSCDKKDVNKVSTYAIKKKMELEKISEKFTNLSYLGKVWDSKVPEVDKKFYHFFTLTQTNCAEVQEEVQKYKTFYKDMIDALHKINVEQESCNGESSNASNEKDSNDNMPEAGNVNESKDPISEEELSSASHEKKKEEDDIESGIIEPYEIILKMNEKVSEMVEAAKTGKEFTASSAVYKLHKSFIQKHKKLEHMIKRVECVALKQGLKKAIDGWNDSKQSLKKLENDLSSTNEKCDQMNEKLDQVIEESKILREILKKCFKEDTKNSEPIPGSSAEGKSDD